MLNKSNNEVAIKSVKNLQIHKNGRYLQKEDGSPFFYLADTAWELVHKLNRLEIEEYLKDRVAKGFNVIQFVLLAELDGLTIRNAYGDLPLINQDPSKPALTSGNNPISDEEYDYWDHVDFVINTCENIGIYAGVLPTWGDKVFVKWGPGPEIFTSLNAYTYGNFLGNRYKNKKNIIWILGGDRPAMEGLIDKRDIWDAMAEGITDGVNGLFNYDGIADYNSTLITYHPIGGKSSSVWFHEKEWLDFNMYQSGHSKKDNSLVWQIIEYDWKKLPFKPSLDGEPNYEDHPVNNNPKNGWFNDYDVRKASYRSVFSGSAGITYGAHGVWQMYSSTRNPITYVRTFWYDSLNLPGSFQMKFLSNLLFSRPYFLRIPDNSLVENIGIGDTRMAACISEDGSYAMIYFPKKINQKIFVSKLSGTKINTWWYNPRNGKCYNQAGEETTSPFSIKKEDTIFTPPDDNDWVLVLDDIEKKYNKPGQY